MTKKKESNPNPMDMPFPITSVCREDLINPQVGFTKKQAQSVSDEQMQRIAGKMADDYCNQLFWTSLEIIAGIVLNEK
jgi:hypothetical protein